MNPYSYPPIEPRFNLQLKETNSKWLHYAVDFPIARPTSCKEHNTALGEYYQPSEGDNWPLAILVHGWGDHSTLPCNLLAKDLAKIGIASFILYLVFHSSRMPDAIKRRLPNLTAEEWFEGYQMSVIDVRQIVDWASSNGRINKEQIAVIGMSLGGMISALSMAVDKRIHAGVILISGGNYENPEWLRRTGQKRTEAEYAEAQKMYAQYLSEVAQKGFENVEPPKKSYLTDPMTFASYLRQRPVLMINAKLDERIPRQSTLDLWEASGKPQIKWLPGTHSSIWLLYPLIRREIFSFLSSTFSM
jgi:predicted esterase